MEDCIGCFPRWIIAMNEPFLPVLRWLGVAVTCFVAIAGYLLYTASQEKQTFYCGVSLEDPGYCGTNKNVVVAPADQQSYEMGKALYENNCRPCHALDEIQVGPALRGIQEKRGRRWLTKFIRNSQKMVAKKDSAAVAIYEMYAKQAMPSFEAISQDEIDAILVYLRY